MNDVNMITIPRAVYDGLMRDRNWLMCLEDAGVDNWVGYDEARQLYKELQNDE